MFEDFIDFVSSKGLYFDRQTLLLLYSAIAQRAPIMLRGPAGTGKTEITKVIAEYLNAEYIFYQCTTGTTEDDFIYKILPAEHTKSGVQLVLGHLPEALKKSQKMRVVLVLDEFDKTRPSCDALLLDFLQNYRISTRISNSEKEIMGNPENLWVIITSNDERDFSEPLLRRVVSIYFKPLKPSIVRDVLKSKGFSDDIVNLLVQLYKDTLNAGLRKPATIQELIQLAKAIEILGENSDWTSLVRAYVIKDDMDWQRYVEYLQNRDQGYEEDNDDVDITEYYEKVEEEEDEKERWEPRMPKLRVKSVKTEVKETEVVSDDREVAMTMKFNENNYDRVIKDFEPEPTDNPAIFGDFKIVKEDDELYIVKQNPLKLRDIVNVGSIDKVHVKSFLHAEDSKFYMNDYVDLTNDFVKPFIKELDVLYYTKDLLRFKYKANVDFILQRTENFGKWSKWKIEMIIEGGYYISSKIETVISLFLRFSPILKASEEFTEKAKEIAKSTVITVDANNIWDAEKKATETRAFKELKSKLEELRKRVVEDWNVEQVFSLDTIKVMVRYNKGTIRVPIVYNEKNRLIGGIFY